MIDASTAFASGPSFPRGLKCIATVGMLTMMWWGSRVVVRLAQEEVPTLAVAFVVVSTLLVIAGYVSIMLSQTAISESEISQGWLWLTRTALVDIAQVKLLRLKPLDSVFAPRLVVRVKGRGTITFHSADPQVLQLFDLFVRGEPPAVSRR